MAFSVLEPRNWGVDIKGEEQEEVQCVCQYVEDCAWTDQRKPLHWNLIIPGDHYKNDEKRQGEQCHSTWTGCQTLSYTELQHRLREDTVSHIDQMLHRCLAWEAEVHHKEAIAGVVLCEEWKEWKLIGKGECVFEVWARSCEVEAKSGWKTGKWKCFSG